MVLAAETGFKEQVIFKTIYQRFNAKEGHLTDNTFDPC
jgi:hypothetical protein